MHWCYFAAPPFMPGAAAPPRMPTAGRGQRYAVSMVDEHQPGGSSYFDRSKPPEVNVVSVHCEQCLWKTKICRRLTLSH